MILYCGIKGFTLSLTVLLQTQVRNRYIKFKIYRFHTFFFPPISRRFSQIMLSKASELLLSIHNTIKKTNMTGLLILIRINFWIRGLGIHVHICTQYIQEFTFHLGRHFTRNIHSKIIIMNQRFHCNIYLVYIKLQMHVYKIQTI